MKFIFASGSRPLAGYTIKRGLGRGGFGEVYYAVSDAGKDVALKLIRRNLDIELRGVGHCLNLKHPHLLTLFDIKQDDEDNTWIVMEYIAGESLEDRLARAPQGLAPEEACQWARGAAAGLAYLHEHGIVHRDLKPGNIFADEGIIKLGDYGLSKFISCSRRSGQTDSVGTVHYMAPEVANGRYGKQIDIYALGVLLYEALTGRVPFEGESVGEVLMKHLTATPDVSALAEPYRSTVARAMAKDPGARFDSVEDLVDQLPAFPGARLATFAVNPARAPLGEGAPESAAPRAMISTPSAQKAATAPAAPEPIADAVRDLWNEARDWWNSPNVGSSVKVLVAFAGIYLFSNHYDSLIPWTAALLVAYASYRLVRAVALGARRVGVPATGSTASGAPDAGLDDRARLMGGAADATPDASGADLPPVTALDSRGALASVPRDPSRDLGPDDAREDFGRRPRLACHNRSQRARPSKLPAALIAKPARERIADLLGSMLFASGATAVVSVLLLLARGVPPEAAQFAWLWIVSTLGTWSVLAPAKRWEATRGDGARRRFAMSVLGLGVGAVSWGLSDVLMVSLPRMSHGAGGDWGENTRIRLTGLFSLTGEPLAGAFLLFFGLLFLSLRWWRQADPLRPRRVSLGATALAVLAAWVIHIFCPFPQPWGLMVAAAVSLATQLASPWQGNR